MYTLSAFTTALSNVGLIFEMSFIQNPHNFPFILPLRLKTDC